MTVQPTTETASIDALLGERVHQEMWRRRVSQTTMAPFLGVTQSVLSRKLRGAVSWSVADLYAAASVLAVEPETLLPRLDSNQQPSD